MHLQSRLGGDVTKPAREMSANVKDLGGANRSCDPGRYKLKTISHAEVLKIMQEITLEPWYNDRSVSLRVLG